MAKNRPARRANKPVKSRQRRSVLAYPLIIFLLLCSGVFLVGWTLKSGALDIHVTAKVSAPPVTDPAVITSPTNGSHFTSIPITVEGTCPTDPAYTAAYVEVFDNNVLRGTAICDGSNQFNLSIDLFPGANTLTAHVFNSTDDEGPVSDPVDVIYDAPQPPPTNNGGGSNSGQGSNPGGSTTPLTPISIKTAFIYKGYHVGDPVIWPLDISGGAKPYAVSVDWGDGTSDLISRSLAGEFKINHVYSDAGGYKGSYVIKVKASDAAGQSAFLQFFVIVTPASINQAGNIFSKPPPTIPISHNWLWIAWPAYLLVFLMALSYWLGEREELIIMRKKGLIKRRRT